MVLWLGGLHGELADDAVVAGLGVGQGKTAVDLQRGAGGVAGVGLDEGIVDALGLTGEQEVPEPVGWHVVGQAGFAGVAGEHGADAAGGVRLLP